MRMEEGTPLSTQSFWTSIYQLQQQGVMCDVNLYVKNNLGDYDIIPTHKVALVGSSEYFYSSLIQSGELLDIYHFDGISYENLQVVVDYIYRQISWEELLKNNEAMTAAQTLQIVQHELTDGKHDIIPAVNKPKVMFVKMSYADKEDGSKETVLVVDEERERKKKPKSKEVKMCNQMIQTDLVDASKHSCGPKVRAKASQKHDVATDLVSLCEIMENIETPRVKCKSSTGMNNQRVILDKNNPDTETDSMDTDQNRVGMNQMHLDMEENHLDLEENHSDVEQMHSVMEATRQDIGVLGHDSKLVVIKEEDGRVRTSLTEIKPDENNISYKGRNEVTPVKKQSKPTKNISETSLSVIVKDEPLSSVRRSGRTPKPSRLWREMDRPTMRKTTSVSGESDEDEEFLGDLDEKVISVKVVRPRKHCSLEKSIKKVDSKHKNEDMTEVIEGTEVAQENKVEKQAAEMGEGFKEEDASEHGGNSSKMEEQFERQNDEQGPKTVMRKRRMFTMEDDEMSSRIVGSSEVDLCVDQRKVPKSCKCKLCGKVTSSVTGLVLHERKRHNLVRTYTCVRCAERFETNRQLKSHLSKVHNIIKFACDQCGANFKTREGWRYHFQKQHAGASVVASHVCDICGKQFLLKHALTSHMKFKHSDTRPFQCNLCERAFKNKQMLNRHVDTFHSNVRKHMCDVCGMMFKTRNDMRRHHEKHFREGQEIGEQGRGKKFPDGLEYKCTFCGKIFNKRNQQLTHENLQHRQKASGTSFLCTLCNKNFPIKHYLMQHIKNRHMPKRFQCSQCCIEFVQKSDLIKHQSTLGRCKGEVPGQKPFQCPTCGKGFTLKGNLTKHLAAPGRCRGTVDMMSDVIVVVQHQNGEEPQQVQEQGQAEVVVPDDGTAQVSYTILPMEEEGDTMQHILLQEIGDVQLQEIANNELQQPVQVLEDDVGAGQVDQPLPSVEVQQEVLIQEVDCAETCVQEAVIEGVDTPVKFLVRKGVDGEMVYTFESQAVLEELDQHLIVEQQPAV